MVTFTAIVYSKTIKWEIIKIFQAASLSCDSKALLVNNK